MSTQTTNLKLVKPDVNDFYDIGVQNSNMDIIDSVVNNHTSNKSNPHGVTAEQIGSITAMTEVNPTTTGYSTLLEWLLDMKEKGHYSVSTTISNFADMPQMDWTYGLFARLQGNICVEIWKFLSGGTIIQRRETNAENEWSGDWTTTCLPLSGGTLTGILELKKANNGYTRFYKNHSDTADYGTTILDVDKNENKMELILRSDLQRLILTINGVEYSVLTKHNKPANTYSGTGVTRTINTGGIGSTLMIHANNSHNALVTPHGAMCFFGTTMASFGGDVIRFAEGVLTIGTSNPTNDYFNANGVTYTYQVL